MNTIDHRPVQTADAPKERPASERELLNLGLFSVEHPVSEQAAREMAALAQRNYDAALRNRLI